MKDPLQDLMLSLDVLKSQSKRYESCLRELADAVGNLTRAREDLALDLSTGAETEEMKAAISSYYVAQLRFIRLAADSDASRAAYAAAEVETLKATHKSIA